MRAALPPRQLFVPLDAISMNSRGTTQKFNESAQQIESARAIVGDVSTTLRDYAERINASPERLAEIEDRLALLDRLKRKYGQDRG